MEQQSDFNIRGNTWFHLFMEAVGAGVFLRCSSFFPTSPTRLFMADQTAIIQIALQTNNVGALNKTKQNKAQPRLKATPL